MKKLTLLVIAGLCFSVSVGAQTLQEKKEIERAKAFVKSKGLTWGGQGVYATKGLYTYDRSNSRYYGKAYFGIGGKVSQQSAPVRKPKERIPGWFEIALEDTAEVDTGLARKIPGRKIGLPKNSYTKLNIDTKKPLTQQEINTGDWRMVSRDTRSSTEYYKNSKKEKEASMRKLKKPLAKKSLAKKQKLSKPDAKNLGNSRESALAQQNETRPATKTRPRPKKPRLAPQAPKLK